MEYLAVAVVFGILFGCFAFLDEKRKEMRREINGLYDTLSRQNDRLDVFQDDRNAIAKDVKAMKAALPGLTEQVKELSETVKVRDKQEQMVLEGMNNILNYTVDVARKAVGDDAEG